MYLKEFSDIFTWFSYPMFIHWTEQVVQWFFGGMIEELSQKILKVMLNFLFFRFEINRSIHLYSKMCHFMAYYCSCCKQHLKSAQRPYINCHLFYTICVFVCLNLVSREKCVKCLDCKSHCTDYKLPKSILKHFDNDEIKISYE